jgi:broad specificity phosphatase PhoE
MIESESMNQDPTIFYIVRHGETDHNVNQIIQGHLDTDLNENGMSQAIKMGHKLAEIKFDNAFSSDLKRAHKTAQLITEKKEVEVKTDKLLREMYLGSYEGRKIEDFHKELGDLIAHRDSLPAEERLTHRVADIETDKEIVDRFMDFFNSTNDLTKGKRNLLVTHGAAMRVLLIHFGWASYSELQHGMIDNTAYIILEKNGDTFKIKDTYGIKKL